MMAIRLEPNERTVVNLYDRPEPGLRLSRKTLLAFTAVAVFYAGIGAVVMSQRIKIEEAPFPPSTPISMTPWKIEKRPDVRPTKVLPPPSAIRNPIPSTVPIDVPPYTATPTDEPVAPIGPIAALPTEPIPGPAVEPVPTTPPAPVMIRNPNWLSKPTAAQLGRIYPDRAAERGMSGAATLLCGVSASGAMVGCSVIDESPKGWRFGEAALASTRFFKMSPRTVDGQAVEGAKVRIPIVFNLAG